MPKTSMDKYGRLVLGQNNIWFAGQIVVVKSKSKPQMVQKLSRLEFWLSIAASD
jgi:hypothetical protein